MSNERVYGKEAHRMSFAEAIPEILCDYKIIGIGVSDIEVKKFLDQRNFVTNDETIDEYAHNYALKIAMEKYKAFHALSFHHTVNGSKSFSERHSSLFGESIFSKYVSGKHSSGIRQAILKEFSKRDIGLVANARCLTEGVDVPTIDLIYFCDPKNSKVSIVQAAGRALRKDRTGKKTLGYIVVPIFHRQEEQVERAIDQSVFKNVIQVIRSLCDHDERLQAEINDIAFKKGKKRNSKIEFSFSNDETERIIKLVGFKEKLKTSLFNQIIEKTNDSWDLRYRELKEYYDEYGDSDVPARYVNKTLGTWCVRQRVDFKAGKLSISEINKLELLDFNFKPRGNRVKYIIDKVKEFKTKYGHTNVPINSEDFPKLGKLINRYRDVYKNGIVQPDGSIIRKGIGTLKKVDIKKLNDIGFIWQVRRRSWNAFFEEAEQYYFKNGSLKGLQKENPSLYIWIYNNRKKLKTLSKPKVDNLNTIGVNSNDSKSNKTNISWEERFKDLVKFKNKFKHLDVPRHLPEYKSLYIWLKFQINAVKNNKLSSEKVSELVSIGLIERTEKVLPDGQQKLNFEKEETNTNNKPYSKRRTWNEYYLELIDYKIKFGNTQVSRYDENYGSLGYWVYKQRLEFGKNKLDKNCIAKLEQIDFDFEIKGRRKIEAWTQHYNELNEFFNQNKHSHFIKNSGNPTLYHWVLAQRVANKKGKLSQQRIKKLDEIKFVWKPFNDGKMADDDNWLNHLIKLREYKDKFGDTNVSQVDKNPEFKKLGKWLNEQRNYKKGRKLGKRIVFLSKEKEELLNGLGIIWDVKGHEWNQRLAELKIYYEKFNSWKVPLNNKEFGGLGHWIYRIRKKGTTSERAEKLKKIGYDVSELLIKN